MWVHSSGDQSKRLTGFIGASCWTMVLCCGLVVATSCRTGKAPASAGMGPLGRFADLYKEMRSEQTSEVRPRQVGRQVTLSCSGLSMVEFSRLLADKCQVSIAWDASLDKFPVTVEAKDQDVSVVLGVVARRAGCQLSRTGNLFFLGTLKPE